MITQSYDMRGLYLLTASNTLAAKLELFLIYRRVDNLSEATIHDYKVKVGHFVRFCQKTNIESLSDINQSIINLFFLDLKQRDKPSSVLGYHKSIKCFFNWLVEQGCLQNNPMEKMKSPRVPEILIQPFSEEQIRSMLAVCNEGHVLGMRNKAMILVLYDTGVRRSELLSMKLQDIDFSRGIVKVMGKGARERVVRMGRGTQRALLKYLLMRHDSNEYVWVTQYNKPFSLPDGLTRLIKLLGKEAGITGVRCSAHTFRHTFATDSLRNGAGEFDVQSLLGHKDLRMTRRYSATLRSEYAAKQHERFSPVDRMGIK